MIAQVLAGARRGHSFHFEGYRFQLRRRPAVSTQILEYLLLAVSLQKA